VSFERVREREIGAEGKLKAPCRSTTEVRRVGESAAILLYDVISRVVGRSDTVNH